MRVGRPVAILVAVLALGACGDDDDGGQTQGTEDVSEAWAQLTPQQQQYACDAFRTVGAQGAGNQIATISDGRIDADAAATVLEQEC